MTELEITKISSEILPDSFDCGNPSINALIWESYYPTILQHAYAFRFSTGGTTLGYYMLKFLNIKLDTCPEDISDYTSNIIDTCFSIHIKYIGVDRSYQGCGIGHSMLKYIIKSVLELCHQWPIRLITIDALKEKYTWYKDLGFVAFNEADLENSAPTIYMYLDCLLDCDSVNNYSENVC